MELRTVATVSPGVRFPMGGFTIYQPLPGQGLDTADPFLLLHHGSATIEAGAHPRATGVGPHPHRGFSPVTFVYKGEVHHRDSRGNSSVIGPGGVQWLDAGMGIVHSERASAELAAQGGPQELIQLWVNTPGRHKFEQPRYQAFTAEEIPTWDEPGARLALVAGQLLGHTGPVATHTPLIALRLSLTPRTALALPIPQGYTALLYVLSGGVQGGGQTWFTHELAHYATPGEGIALTALQPTEALLLAGAPIGEPVAQQGPFVMNTETQVLEAFRDAQLGRMGVLIEEF